MAKTKKVFTISESLKLVEDKFARVVRMPQLIGYRSLDICKSYKNLISICNSLSIIFLQYDLFKEAFLMLQKAVQIDLELSKFGSPEDKLWQGRLITYNSLALLFHKLGRNKESLKLLLQAESFLISLTESNLVPQVDIELSVNMLTFATLWKVKKFKEASIYLERSAKLINEVITAKRASKISKASSNNLYGIIVMGLAALKCIVEEDTKNAIKMCKDAAKQLDANDNLCKPLILDLANFINEHKESAFKFPNISHVEFKPGSFHMFQSQETHNQLPSLRLKNIGDWLITEKYEKILFITTFVPLISSLTPWIDPTELEKAQSRLKSGSLSEGYDKITGKKGRTILSKFSNRTESTPRQKIPSRMDGNSLIQRKFSQKTRINDRLITSQENNRHIMFEFSSNDRNNSNTLPIDLIPLQPGKFALPKLHRTLINFGNIS